MNQSWQEFITQEKQKKYFQNIIHFLKNEEKIGKIIYPKSQNILKAFTLTPLNNLKVVILGQDPYPSINQAHGLSFSVENQKTPASLKNIFKELKNDLNLISYNNNLSLWALEGVLLLNTILTVEANKPLSHQNIGWEIFTQNIFKFLNQKEKIVYVLWGKFSQKYEQYINKKKNYILKSSHPSPLSAHRGFLGSKPFSKINTYLSQNKIKNINWDLNRTEMNQK
ncbi:uracil-DNA glycosylase ['Camptotheca acuminata' phytoplasma]|uniref:uracil-DNA glycosylase n=1 Tax='Camptotheca acuminata' phytoplasma TaxID=3239192 RepID=UPI00351A46F2